MGRSLLGVECSAQVSFHFYPAIRSTGARLGTRLEECCLETPAAFCTFSTVTVGSGHFVTNRWAAEKWGTRSHAAPQVPEKFSGAL